MDTGGTSNKSGDGVHIPDQVPTQSDQVVPQGAPAESSASSEDSARVPLVVVDHDAPRLKLRPLQIAFLAAIAEGLSITGACRAARISKQSHYNWMNAVDAEGRPTEIAVLYRDLFSQAYLAGTDTLVDEAVRRGKDGWLEPKFNKDGDEIGEIRRFDPQLLMFTIKQRDPSFREKYEVTGANGAPLHPDKVEHTHRLDLSLLTEDERAQYRSTVQAQRDLLGKLEERRGLGARQN